MFKVFELWTFFTPFSIVSAVALNKTQLNVCWVPPYQLINAEITNCCNYLPMYGNLSEIEAHKKDCDPN